MHCCSCDLDRNYTTWKFERTNESTKINGVGLWWTAEKAELKLAILKEESKEVSEVTLLELEKEVLHSILYIK